MNWCVENGYVSGGRCYMNIHNLSELKNHNFIYSTQKRDKNAPKLSSMENTALQNGVDIYVMLPVSTLNRYANT